MEREKAAAIVEAILFVAGEPVALGDLARALELGELETMAAVEALERDLEGRGIALKRYGDHVRLETRAVYAPYVERLLQPVQRQSLSQAALETLAVIAYRQPATRGEVEQVRGVKCDYSIQSLLSKGLIREVGRKEALGNPLRLPRRSGPLCGRDACGPRPSGDRHGLRRRLGEHLVCGTPRPCLGVSSLHLRAGAELRAGPPALARSRPPRRTASYALKRL